MRSFYSTCVKCLVVFFLFTSCSQKRMIIMMANTPDLAYDKSQLKGLNKYQKDAIYLTETIKQAYPRLDNKISNEEFEILKDSLLQDLSDIDSDLDFEIRMQTFMALLKDGHSKMLVDYSKDKIGIYPFALYKEKDNWVLANIDRTEVDSVLIGSKIVSINQVPIKEIESRALRYESTENEYWRNIHFLSHITSPVYWKALEVIKSKEDALDFIVSKDGVEKSFTIRSKQKATGYRLPIKDVVYPFTRKQNEGFYYKTDKDANYAYLQMNTCLDYLSLKNEIASYTNFFVRPFALSYLKKQKKDAMNFGLTLQSLFKEINENEIENLIIDLRYNTGGDERTGKQLVWYLCENQDIKGYATYVHISDFFRQSVKQDYIKYDKLYREKIGKPLPYREVNINDKLYPTYFSDIIYDNSPYLLDNSIPKFKGKVYILIGNLTFSAAQMLATTIKDNKLGTFIGQPTGNMPTGQTGYTQFKLPHTKKIINLSYMYMERPDKSKNQERALYPDIELTPDFQDLLNGRNISFEYILNEIKKSDN